MPRNKATDRLTPEHTLHIFAMFSLGDALAYRLRAVPRTPYDIDKFQASLDDALRAADLVDSVTELTQLTHIVAHRQEENVANFAAWLLMHIVHAIERAEPFPVAEPQVAPLLSLSLELHCVILAHLELSSLLSVSYTCKTLRNALLHPYAWARICHASDGGIDILELERPSRSKRRERTRRQAAVLLSAPRIIDIARTDRSRSLIRFVHPALQSGVRLGYPIALATPALNFTRTLSDEYLRQLFHSVRAVVSAGSVAHRDLRPYWTHIPVALLRSAQSVATTETLWCCHRSASAMYLFGQGGVAASDGQPLLSGDDDSFGRSLHFVCMLLRSLAFPQWYAVDRPVVPGHLCGLPMKVQRAISYLMQTMGRTMSSTPIHEALDTGKLYLLPRLADLAPVSAAGEWRRTRRPEAIVGGVLRAWLEERSQPQYCLLAALSPAAYDDQRDATSLMAVLLALSVENQQFAQSLPSLEKLAADVADFVHDRDSKQGKGV